MVIRVMFVDDKKIRVIWNKIIVSLHLKSIGLGLSIRCPPVLSALFPLSECFIHLFFPGDRSHACINHFESAALMQRCEARSLHLFVHFECFSMVHSWQVGASVV